jgi:hypothetical protein
MVSGIVPVGNRKLSNCRGLVGDDTGPRLIYITDEAACVIDVSKEKVIGEVPVDPDTDERVNFGPSPGTCIVGSWVRELRALSYADGRQLWATNLNRIDDIQHFGSRPVIKVRREGSVLVDFKTGRAIKKLTWQNTFLHPHEEWKATYDERTRQMTFEAGGRSKPVVVPGKSFAVLSHAWSPQEFVWGSPEGDLVVYSFAKRRVVVDIRPSYWFNVAALTFNEEKGCFCGLATDFKGTNAHCLFVIPTRSEGISDVIGLPHPGSACLLDRGRLMASSKGRIVSTLNGSLVKHLDFRAMLGC